MRKAHSVGILGAARVRSGKRAAGRAWAAERAAAAVEAGGVSGRQLADHIGIEHHGVGDMLRGLAPIHLGDMQCWPRSVAIALLRRLADELEATSPPVSLGAAVRLRRSMVKVGRAAEVADEALADNVITLAERRALVPVVHEAAAELAAWERELSAHCSTEPATAT
jgi:hypothetical protein